MHRLSIRINTFLSWTVRVLTLFTGIFNPWKPHFKTQRYLSPAISMFSGGPSGVEIRFSARRTQRNALKNRVKTPSRVAIFVYCFVTSLVSPRLPQKQREGPGINLVQHIVFVRESLIKFQFQGLHRKLFEIPIWELNGKISHYWENTGTKNSFLGIMLGITFCISLPRIL